MNRNYCMISRLPMITTIFVYYAIAVKYRPINFTNSRRKKLAYVATERAPVYIISGALPPSPLMVYSLLYPCGIYTCLSTVPTDFPSAPDIEVSFTSDGTPEVEISFTVSSLKH